MKKPDFLRKPMTLEVKSVAGITPDELFKKEIQPLLAKKSPTERIIEKEFSKLNLYEKPRKFKLLLNKIKYYIIVKVKNLYQIAKFKVSKVFIKIKEISEIPSFILIHGVIVWFVLLTIFGFKVSWYSLIHIVGGGSMYYLIMDLIKMVRGK